MNRYHHHDQMNFPNQSIPSGHLTYLLNMAIEIVCLPMNSMVDLSWSFHSFLFMFTRGYIHSYPSMIHYENHDQPLSTTIIKYENHCELWKITTFNGKKKTLFQWPCSLCKLPEGNPWLIQKRGRVILPFPPLPFFGPRGPKCFKAAATWALVKPMSTRVPGAEPAGRWARILVWMDSCDLRI